MTSPAQIQANRTNAQKSTGPRTAEGKAAVAQNALKHGLRARHAVIVGEDVGEFETYRDQMLTELAPEGPIESTLAHRAVGLAWRLQRAERLQNQAFDALHAKDTTSPLARLTQSLRPKEPALSVAERDQPHPAQADADLTLGRIVVKDFAHTRVLDRLLMYERRLEHSLYKTIAELQRLRLLRQINPPEQTPAPRADASPPPNRAKQTQFPNTNSDRKHLATSRLHPNTPITPEAEQTQSLRSKDLQRRGQYPKNRCQKTTRRLIVETKTPPARKASRRDARTPQTKGNVA